jgi:predicted ferric reductase
MTTRQINKILIILLYVSNLITIIYIWSGHSLQLLTAGDGAWMLGLGRLCGLLLAFSVLMQFMLIGRIKWIESVFGLDKLSRVHKWNGYSLLLFLILHPLLIILSYGHANDFGFFRQLGFMVSNMEDILGAAIAACLFILIIFLSIAIVRMRLKYETWYAVHLLTYLAILLAFGHQLKLGEDLLSADFSKNYWYFLYAFVGINFVWYRLLKPVLQSYQYDFKISHVVQETYDTLSIYISGAGIQDFQVQPGQFIIVRFLQWPYVTEAHPFSISYIPKNNELRITPKGVGDFTKTLHGLKLGTKVLIDGPHGVFVSTQKSHNKTLLIAGGVGITPLRALAEELSQKEEDIILLYGNKTTKDIVFKEELEHIPNLTIHHIMSSPDSEWKGLTGYIDKEKIQRLVPDIKDRDIFLCGPPVMMDLVRNLFISMGIPRSQIIWEKFSL